MAETTAQAQEVTIVYWRDMPAQVIVGRGRRAIKRPLPERFEQAIDRAAMKSGATGTDAYLADWRKAPQGAFPGTAEDLAADWAGRIAAEYDTDRLKRLVETGGWG